MVLMTLIILLLLIISRACEGIHEDIKPVGPLKVEVLAPGKDPIVQRSVLWRS